MIGTASITSNPVQFSGWFRRKPKKSPSEISTETKPSETKDKNLRTKILSAAGDVVDVGIGLIPGIGDAAGGVLSIPLLIKAVRKKVGWRVFALVLALNAADVGIGLTPGAGDIADVFPAKTISALVLSRAIKQKDPQADNVLKKRY